MNGAENPGAGALLLCVSWAPGLLAQAEALHAGIPAASLPFMGLGPHTPVWPIRPSPLFPTMWGVEEAATSALRLPNSVCREKVRYRVGDRRAHPQGAIPGSGRVNKDVRFRAEIDQVGGGVCGLSFESQMQAG